MTKETIETLIEAIMFLGGALLLARVLQVIGQRYNVPGFQN